MYSVLYVDDEEHLLAIAKLFLEETGEFVVETALSGTAALGLMQDHPFDTIVADYQMSGMDGIVLLKKVREKFGAVPFILFTGKGREEVVIEAINNGADFYLQKGGAPEALFAELAHKIRQSVKRNRTEASLRKSEEKFRSLVEYALEGIAILDFSGNVLFANSAVSRTLETDMASIAGANVMQFIAPESRDAVIRDFINVAQGHDAYPAEYSVVTAKGNRIRVESIGKVIQYEGKPADLVSIRDITEQAGAEEALRQSEIRFRSIIQNATDYITLLDKNGRFAYLSPSAEKALGYPENSLNGTDPLDLVHPEDRDRIRMELASSFRAGTRGSPVEYRIRKADGSDICVESLSSCLVDAPSVQGVVITTRDVTGRKQDEAELRAAYQQLAAAEEELQRKFAELDRSREIIRQSEARFRRAELAAHVGHWEINPETKRVTASAEARKIYGLGDGELTIADIRGIPLPEFRPLLDAAMENLVVHGEPYDVEFTIRNTVDQSVRVIHSVAEFDPEMRTVFGIIQDITGRKKAESALKDAYRKLNLLSSITRHDIVNQLVALRSYLALSQSRTADPVVRDFIGKAEEISALIEHQIVFTRDYQNIGSGSPGWQNAGAAIRAAMKGPEPGTVKMTPDLGTVEILADPLFERALYNLIDNALRHGGEKMTQIAFSSRATEQGLIIACEDDGIGIPDDEKEEIFTLEHGRNTGLGLFLIRDILAITGMTIVENGIFGKGARFEIAVPEGSFRIAAPTTRGPEP